MFKRILVPTDGSNYSSKAADYAIWIARKSNAEIIALNVVETSRLPDIRSKELKNQLHDMMESEGKAALENIHKIFENNKEDLKTTFLIKKGSPADMILKTIEEKDIDLVIMGTSGKHGLDRLFLGSVAEKVLRNANCTVTVAR